MKTVKLIGSILILLGYTALLIIDWKIGLAVMSLTVGVNMVNTVNLTESLAKLMDEIAKELESV